MTKIGIIFSFFVSYRLAMIRDCFAIFVLVLFGCSAPLPVKKEMKIEGFAQGTTYHIRYLSTNNRDYERSIDSILIEIDRSLSTYHQKSIISKFNQSNDTIKVDQLFTDVFTISKDVYQLTGGAFNPAIAPIVNAWGFGFDEAEKVDPVMIDSLIRYVNFDNIFIKEGVAYKQHKNIMLDFNAVAQGYSVEVLSDFLLAQGVENYMVEVGGELKTAGKNANDTLWRVGIDKPLPDMQEREIEAIAHLDNKAIATSGNYRKWKEKDGIKYAHTINPKTGYPIIHNLLSATVINNNCAYADAYATAFMVLGLEKSKQFLKDSDELDGILIYSDDKGVLRTFITDGIKKNIELNPNK